MQYFKRIQIVFLLIFCFNFKVFGQFLKNPSFEQGSYGTPTDWIACNEQSTPDIQPGKWGVSIPASDGIQYLGLTIRGDEHGSDKAKNEGLCTQLIETMWKGSCYSLKVDLAKSLESNDGIPYPNSSCFRVWGGGYACHKSELLAQTSLIEHADWRTYELILNPSIDCYYLMIEVYQPVRRAGYLLVDNLVLEKYSENFYRVKMDTTIQPDDYLILDASESPEYSWRPNYGLSCYDCQSPEVETETSVTFICSLIDENGCPFEEVYSITVDIFIPDVFTPNGDGINEIFRIDGLERNSELIIFNRLGKVVYSNSDYHNTWDGTDNSNIELPSDTYWYVLKIPGHKNEFKGFVFLKR